MSTIINPKYFKTTFFLLILAEILSYLGWQNLIINYVCFAIIILATFFLSLKKLEYGIYILFAELFVGSKGYLFALPVGGFCVSARIGIFVVVMMVYLDNVILRTTQSEDEGSHRSRYNLFNKVKYVFHGIPHLSFVKDRFGMTLTLLATVLLWAFVWGIIRGNNFSNVFFDFNNWLYWLVILPVMFVILRPPFTPPYKGGDESNVFLKNILSIFAAAVLLIGLKTLILFYFFTHNFAFIGSDIYRWVRDTGVGEITNMGGGFYRIFIQSQIYSLLYFFILFCASLGVCHPEFISGSQDLENSQSKEMLKQVQHDNKKLLITYYSLLIISLITIILSFSRSFWLGLVLGLFIYLFYSLFIIHYSLFTLFKSFSKLVIIAIISLSLIISVLYLPPKIQNLDWAKIFGQRATQGEAASNSRLNELKPLLFAIAKHPIIGSGFGTAVTYYSTDPRINGIVTTYAFEWGYLDMILKFGLVGWSVYLYIIFRILKCFLGRCHSDDQPIRQGGGIPEFFQEIPRSARDDKEKNYSLYFGFALALIAILVVNIFSPYLNHPLGIGFIIITLLLVL